MKLLLVSLVAALALGLQAPVYAYQEEGPYVDLNLGMMSGKVDTSYSSSFGGATYRIADKGKHGDSLLFSLGGGYSYNLTNSINWQYGLEYYQWGGLKSKGATHWNTAELWNYKYKIRSSGYLLTNTFHFDVLTGNLTPIQPYVTILFGLARNNFYDYSANSVSTTPEQFISHTTNNIAYGTNLGLSYQYSMHQVFNFSLNYLSLGKVSSKGSINPTSDINLTDKNLAVTGFQFGYLLQF